jgi:hypothetical protein
MIAAIARKQAATLKFTLTATSKDLRMALVLRCAARRTP